MLQTIEPNRENATQKRPRETKQGLTGFNTMARIEMENADMAALGAANNADILFEMGMMYATGRECDVDMIAAHKWFNIAAIKGCSRAALLRAEVAETMTKPDLARALREAREWMTCH